MLKDKLRYFFNNNDLIKSHSTGLFEVDTWKLSWFVTKKYYQFQVFILTLWTN